MPRTIALIRTIRFRATHHYSVKDWDEVRNRHAFGALVDPHPHDYVVTVEVEGEPDPITGFVVDLPFLDALLEEAVGPLRGADLNQAIPEVAQGRAQPSTEFLARWIWDRLEPGMSGSARLRRVRVAESAELAGEVVSS